MLTKATAKFIKSLQLKKYRKQEQLFTVEGVKSVLEVLKSNFEVKMLIGTEAFFQSNNIDQPLETFTVLPKQLSTLGSFKTNDGAMAVVSQKPNVPVYVEDELVLVLDGVNDPGNLGTILRCADWYGINKIIASEHTVELYNPKVIAASKGSFCRVDIYYTDLATFLPTTHLPKYGAFMHGENLHYTKLAEHGLVILGNEANGISKEIEALVDHKVTIPSFGDAESLNVAMAAAVLCDNFRRRN